RTIREVRQYHVDRLPRDPDLTAAVRSSWLHLQLVASLKVEIRVINLQGSAFAYVNDRSAIDRLNAGNIAILWCRVGCIRGRIDHRKTSPSRRTAGCRHVRAVARSNE